MYTYVIYYKKSKKWMDYLSTFDHHVDLPKLRKTVKSLNQGSNKPASPNQSISFNGKVISDLRKIAAKFNKQFTSVVSTVAWHQ